MEEQDLDNLESDETEQAEPHETAHSAVGDAVDDAQGESPGEGGDAEQTAESVAMPEAALDDDPDHSEAESAEESGQAIPDDEPKYPEPSDEHGSYLIVDGGNAGDIATNWQTEINRHERGVPFIFATAEEAKAKLLSGSVLGLAVIADDVTQEVEDVFKAFKLCVGAIGPFQAIICSDPSPEYMAAMFEFNVETFYAREEWGPEVAAHSRFIRDAVKDSESSERKAIELSRTIRGGDQTKIEALQDSLRESSEYDSLAAYSFGKSLEASGKYIEAIDAYRKSSGMNKMFHASTMSLGENLIVTGKLDEAQELFEKLEKTNSRNADRKLGLATIHTEKGDFTKAKSYLKDAANIAPKSQKINETKAHMYLKAGKIGEAFKLMDNMSEVGPFFAAKLNEMGIKLSQAGKGKSALALYQKAHKVVKAELKFKISMNAALACYRLGLFQKSLAFLDRCEKEFGKSYEKLEKVRRAVTAALKKTKSKKAA